MRTSDVKGWERWWGEGRNRQGKSRRGGGGTAEDEGSGGVHCGFIPANTFIMADLAEPVTHCRGYISASIPTTSIPPSSPRLPLIPISTQSSPVYPVFWQNLSFSMTSRLFSSILPPPARQKENNRRSFMILFRAMRRYSRVTYACAHTIFSLSIVGIIVKHLPIFSPPVLDDTTDWWDLSTGAGVCFAIRKWLISGGRFTNSPSENSGGF